MKTTEINGFTIYEYAEKPNHLGQIVPFIEIEGLGQYGQVIVVWHLLHPDEEINTVDGLYYLAFPNKKKPLSKEGVETIHNYIQERYPKLSHSAPVVRIMVKTPYRYILEFLDCDTNELRKGEKFCFNVSGNVMPDEFKSLKTARLGEQAYALDGELLDRNLHRPFFIHESEEEALDKIMMDRLKR